MTASLALATSRSVPYSRMSRTETPALVAPASTAKLHLPLPSLRDARYLRAMRTEASLPRTLTSAVTHSDVESLVERPNTDEDLVPGDAADISTRPNSVSYVAISGWQQVNISLVRRCHAQPAEGGHPGPGPRHCAFIGGKKTEKKRSEAVSAAI